MAGKCAKAQGREKAHRVKGWRAILCRQRIDAHGQGAICAGDEAPAAGVAGHGVRLSPNSVLCVLMRKRAAAPAGAARDAALRGGARGPAP